MTRSTGSRKNPGSRGWNRAKPSTGRRGQPPTPGVGWVPLDQRAPAPAPPAPVPAPPRRRTPDRESVYELRSSPHASSSRQGEVLNVALSARPDPLDRMIVGRNVRTGAAVTFDAFKSYADPNESQFSSIQVSVTGDVGTGKSTVLKTLFALRPLLLGRSVVVLDKKRQGEEGEYAPLARAVGTVPVRFVPGGGPGCSSINIIDPRIGIATASGESTSEGRPAGQLELINQVIAAAMGSKLGVLPAEAVRVALLAAPARAASEHREPVLADVIWCLQHPNADQIGALYDNSWTVEQMFAWGIEAAAALLGLVNGPLGGIIDRPTSAEVEIDHPSGLTVFDISALPSSGPTLGIVMLLIQTWLSGLLARRSAARKQTILIVEEGWFVAEDDGMGQMFKENAKLSRALGVQLVSGVHHASDLPPTSPARALMQEASTHLLFAQEKLDDVLETLKISGLPANLAAEVMSLPVGECIIVRSGADPEHVRVDISDYEKLLTDTNGQITGADAVDFDEWLLELDEAQP